MAIGLHIPRRTRLRLALLLACALLMQQLALAAHACNWAAPPVTMPSVDDCEGMSMPAPAGSGDALCDGHCAQQAPTVPDVRMPTVPPDMLPSLPPDAVVLLPLASAASTPAPCVEPHPSPPPATILYCTLQI